MSKSVISQKDVRSVFKKLEGVRNASFSGMCYLCGRSFHKGENRKTEHVIPRSLLRLASDVGRSPYPLVLPVHSKCDEKHKSQSDELIKSFHQLVIDSESGSGDSYKRLVKTVKLDEAKQVDRDHHLVPGAGPILAAAENWFKGCYTALYEKYAITERVGYKIFGPIHWVDDRSSTKISDQLLNQDRVESTAKELFAKVEQQGSCDVVRAWGDTVHFRSFWTGSNTKTQLESGRIIRSSRGAYVRARRFPWIMLWELHVPGANKLAELSGRDSVWHGFYSDSELPEGASFFELPEK